MKTISASSYIQEALKRLVLLFPETRARYEYDIDADTHCVEVMPSKIYHENTEYLEWEDTMVNDFIGTYPDQNIYFFSDDSLVGITKVDFEISGADFEITSTGFEELNAIKEPQFWQNIITQYSNSEIEILKGFNTASNNNRVTNIALNSLIQYGEASFKTANALPTNKAFTENEFCNTTLMVA